jgi:hypothetical protein
MMLGVACWIGEARSQTATKDFLLGRWGQYRETNRLNREDAVAKYNYCPTGGCVLRLEEVAVRPNRARRGQTLTLSTSYTIITPEQVGIPVTISREIFFQGRSLGKTKSMESSRLNGTWTHDIDFSLPADAPKGTYTLITKVITGYNQEEKSVEFTVQ